jgi:hypothetical protein
VTSQDNVQTIRDVTCVIRAKLYGRNLLTCNKAFVEYIEALLAEDLHNSQDLVNI